MDSTFTTSAPNAPRYIARYGAAQNVPRSTTRIPRNGNAGSVVVEANRSGVVVRGAGNAAGVSAAWLNVGAARRADAGVTLSRQGGPGKVRSPSGSVV